MATTEPNVMEILRRRRHMSQASLGQAIGKNQTEVSNIENGIKVAKPEVMQQIAGVLGCENPDLLLQPWRDGLA